MANQDSGQEPILNGITTGESSSTTNVYSRNPMPIEVHTKSGNPIEVNINSQLTTKDIYYTLCQRRDFTLTQLWQQCILMSVFLLLCISGYILIHIFLKELVTELQKLNRILFVISTIFSVIWVKIIAKRTQNHYKSYNQAISELEQNIQYATPKTKNYTNIHANTQNEIIYLYSYLLNILLGALIIGTGIYFNWEQENKSNLLLFIGLSLILPYKLIWIKICKLI